MGRPKDKWMKLYRSVAFRIGLGVSLILLISYAFFTYLVVETQQEFYFHQVVREAAKFSEAVINATKHSMLHDDKEATGNIVRNLASHKEISSIRIYNHAGVTKFSGQPVEIGTKVDKKAEACFACHSEDKPFSQVRSHQTSRVYHHYGGRVLGIIAPIYNEQSCYDAACHVHPKEHKVLGIVDLGISLREFDAHTRSMVVKTVWWGLGTCAAVLITIGVYMAVRVGRPVRHLRDAAWGIALGDYSIKMPEATNDQLGESVQGFKIMRDQIRRRTEELSRSRREYKTLFEQVPCLICVIDKNFEIVRQNSAMRQLFEGTIGVHCYEAFKKRSTKCEDCHADKAFQTGQTIAKEHCGIARGGEEANYISYLSPVTDDKGKIICVMIMAVDLRDKVKLEKELQVSKDFQTNLIENSIHGIIATDEKGRIALFNNAAESMLGHRAQDVIGDTVLSNYFPKQFVKMIVSAHTGNEVADSRLVAHETLIPSADGEAVPVRFTGSILFDQDKPIGAVGFYQDLRTYRKLEREKRASDRLAVVGQTVAGLAHGIKNILQGLEGGVFVVQTAIEDDDKELMNRGWKMLQNNVERISGLVRDLLQYSKERLPQYEETNPNLLAEEVCALFDLRAHEKSVVIERQFDPDLVEVSRIFLDQRGIHTCLSNLVSNAIDACEADTSKVEHRVVVRTRQEPGASVVFEVTDNGVGMDEETKRKVFSSFFSTKGSRGTGLGLLVTSKIVLEHGGEIFFESEHGIGTTFTIRLPMGKAMPAGDSTGGAPIREASIKSSRESEPAAANGLANPS